jgi:hypothetical protein
MPAPPVIVAAPPSKAAEVKDKAKDLDFAKMMALFDKFFPAQPDPDPARLAVARGVALRMWPDGTYGSLLDSFVQSMAGTVLGLKEADLAMFEDKKDGKDKAEAAKPAADANLTLRDKLRRDDPYFDKRMAAITAALKGEFARISPLIEPQLREGLSRSLARRFTPEQLADLNSFYQSPTGQVYARESIKMWFDSDVMRSTMSSMPTLVLQMPAAMQRVEAAAKSYPMPPKSKKPESKSKK